MPWVQIPPPFRGPTQGAERVEVRGTNLRDCLEDLSAQYVGFREQVFDAQGNAQRFIKLFLNGAEVPRQALETVVAPSDQIEILAAVAGG
jgi:molybdopterin converting factor small subunit